MTARKLELSAAIFAALMMMSTPRAEAQSVEDSARAMLYFAIGGGGETSIESDPGLDFTVDNDATVGIGARIEFPLMAYVSIGAQIDMLSYEPEGVERNISGHFDLWAKGRYVFDLSPDLTLEAYGGIPIGLSVLRIEENPALKRPNNGIGWNIGLLAGAQLFFSDRFGATLEMGWRRVQVYNEDASGAVEFTTKMNQFALNMGGVMLF